MNNTLKNCTEIELDDHSLVRMAQSGDSNSFSTLVQRHHAYSLSLAVSILHDRNDAEDEVQNAFLNAFKHIRDFRLDAQFSTWLSRIVMNQCRMHLRSTRRSRTIYLDEANNNTFFKPISLQDTAKSPFQELFSKQITAGVLNEAGRMPPALREVFLLTHFDELPMNEVASELGISVSATKSRLLRARSTLKVRLNRVGRLGLRDAQLNPQPGA